MIHYIRTMIYGIKRITTIDNNPGNPRNHENPGSKMCIILDENVYCYRILVIIIPAIKHVSNYALV